MFAGILVWHTALGDGLPPLEAYGSLPEISMVALSPSGERVAFRHFDGEEEIVGIRDVESGRILGATNVDGVKPRWLTFVNDDYLLLVASDLMRHHRVRGSFEYSGAWVFDVASGKLRRLLTGAEELFPYQGSIGRVIGKNAGGDRVYMPAFSGGDRAQPRYSLFEVDLDRKRQRIIADGRTSTQDWFIDDRARPLIREDFDNQYNEHRLWVVSEREPRLVYEKETNRPSIAPVGLTRDRSTLIYQSRADDADVNAYFSLRLSDGELGGPILGRDDASVERVIRDTNRIVYGVEYAGFLPSYQFFEDELTVRFEAIQSRLSGTSVKLASWSDDFQDLVVSASGGWTSGMYLLFRDGGTEPQLLARQRPAVGDEHVARTLIDEYEAADGLTIPALITARPDVLEAGDAALILLPHGGPSAHDRFQFDWLAQFFASRGYVVMQPQFRGSTGFGLSFGEAGNGEWGDKMQSDLDDGVRHLVKKGLVDEERVCILGASYGGYAALWAGVFSPRMYRCHVSVNGVSDLRAMINRARRAAGEDHWVVDYWETWYGAEASERDAIDAISPAYHAESFIAPVLLVHGKDDTVVPIEQSRRMHSALRRAGKQTTLVALDGEDHWLSRGETRVETLRVIADFIASHLPPN